MAQAATTSRSGLAHTCPDGTRSRLNRQGPTGTLVGVRFTCPACGYTRAAATIRRDVSAVLARLVAR